MENLSKMFKKQKKKKKSMNRFSFMTQFKIEFLLPFTGCKKVFGKMPAFMKLILEEQQKYLQPFINNATYHPMNPDAVTYQTVNLFRSDKCFICFISDVPHYI